MKKEQHVISNQPAPAEHFHREKIGTGHNTHVSGEKILPGRDLASLGCGSDSVASQYISYRLIRELMTQVGEGTRDPVISPTGILFCHSHHQRFHFRFNRRAARILPVFGTIEFLSDESPIPSQNGVRFCNASDLSKRLSSQALSNFSECDAFGIVQAQSRRQFGPQDPVLRRQVLVPKEKFLVHRAGDVGQQS